jgi:hypothetical protein
MKKEFGQVSRLLRMKDFIITIFGLTELQYQIREANIFMELVAGMRIRNSGFRSGFLLFERCATWT